MWSTPVDIVGGFFVAGMESALLRRGVSQLAVRKGAQTACVVGRSIFLILFGLGLVLSQKYSLAPGDSSVPNDG